MAGLHALLMFKMQITGFLEVHKHGIDDQLLLLTTNRMKKWNPLTVPLCSAQHFNAERLCKNRADISFKVFGTTKNW